MTYYPGAIGPEREQLPDYLPKEEALEYWRLVTRIQRSEPLGGNREAYTKIGADMLKHMPSDGELPTPAVQEEARKLRG